MKNLSLVDAYARFGAKPASRLNALSALGADDTLVLSCAARQFGRVEKGVMRYQDRLSRDATQVDEKVLLGQRLTKARDEKLTVRMVVVASSESPAGKTTKTIHVREDVIGTVTQFDGDEFVVEFTQVGNGAAGRGK